MAKTRPRLAGLCLGLLVLKPQLGLLVPVALLAARAWRALAWAVIAGVGLILASVAVFGWGAWMTYVTVIGPAVGHVWLQAPYGMMAHLMMPTPFMAVRGWGGGLVAAYAVQAVVSVGCAVVVWRAWSHRDTPPDLRAALALALVPLASPYAFSYDMVSTAVAVALLMRRVVRDGFLPFEASIFALAWIWPGVSVAVTYAVGPGIGTAGLAGLGWCAWRRLGGFPLAAVSRPGLGQIGAGGAVGRGQGIGKAAD
jgi:hypothetical protein